MAFIPSWQEEMCNAAAKHVPAPEVWHRADGNMKCKVCERFYYDHPQAIPHIWLRVLCDGQFVKL